MRSSVISACVALVIVSAFDTTVSALDGDLIFTGFPFHRVIIEDPSQPLSMTVDESERQEFRLEIAVRGDGYEWASRDNTKLVYAGRSGLFRTWMAENGAGYIRIAPQAAMDSSADSTQYVYVEHIVNRLGSITYWGKGYLAKKLDD